MVYLRQGEPDEIIHPVLAGMMPNETWVYRRGEGDLLLHFKGGGAYTVGGDIQDYRLVRSIFELGAGSDAQIEMLLASRADLLDVYAKFLNWGQYARARAADREQEIVEGSIEVATVTDANVRHYRRSIASEADAVAMGELDGSPAGTPRRRGSIGRRAGRRESGSVARQDSGGLLRCLGRSGPGLRS